MKKKLSKLSITKNQAWSLILNAKSRYGHIKTKRKTITIRDLNLVFIYALKKRKILKKNFCVNKDIGELFDIFLPIIFNQTKSPYIIGHLAQSLDGFIATNSGESRYISCKQNIEHIHRIRAISDVILVGSKTIILDNPRLTTRLVKGNNPMRLILDPRNKLKGTEKVFKNSDKNSFSVIGVNQKRTDKNTFRLPMSRNKFKLNDLIGLFEKLNKKIIFIEGGGYTISGFYKNNLLNRLHLCLSPTVIGQGKNSFLIETKKSIKDFQNHNIKYYKMGKDILCDIEPVTY